MPGPGKVPMVPELNTWDGQKHAREYFTRRCLRARDDKPCSCGPSREGNGVQITLELPGHNIADPDTELLREDGQERHRIPAGASPHVGPGLPLRAALLGATRAAGARCKDNRAALAVPRLRELSTARRTLTTSFPRRLSRFHPALHCPMDFNTKGEAIGGTGNTFGIVS
jgi:hypothetical protein